MRQVEDVSEVDPANATPVSTGNDVERMSRDRDRDRRIRYRRRCSYRRGSTFHRAGAHRQPEGQFLGSNVEYAVHNQHGQQIGAVREVDRGFIRKSRDRHRGRTDAFRTYRLQVVDNSGRVLIALTRPDVWLKSKMIVKGLNGAPIGQIAQKSFVGLIGHRFSLESDDQQLGSIHAESLSAWNCNIQDATGTEIARVTKTWAGWAKERFTKADNYVVEIHRRQEEPLRSLVIAASLALDIALKQGDQTSGSSFWGTRRYQ